MNNIINNKLLEKIERENIRQGLFKCGDKILVGLSGGADSCCLVLSLFALAKRYSLSLCALHVNHMIRGEEADRDEEFARNLCKRLGVEFVCERVDVPSLCRQKGQSTELCARNERYRIFEEVCRQRNINIVATAHNANDNAETMLFNLVRGSGTRGLCGIPSKRALAEGIDVIRPLLSVTRSEIEQYLSNNNQSYVTDSTNLECDYTRNYIRGEVLPLLYKINPSLEESILRSSRLHTIDENYLSRTADSYVTDDMEKLCCLDESILSRVIAIAFSKASDSTPEQLHISSLCEKIYEYKDNKNLDTSVSFPENISARIYKGKLKFVKDDRQKRGQRFDFDVKIGEGATFFENSPYALYITFDQNADEVKTLLNEQNIYKKYTTHYLYFDTIPHDLTARSRRENDKIFTCKMNKSAKRLLSGCGFDAKERKMLPFVCRGENILCIPTVAVSDECKCGDGQRIKAALSLYIKE